MTTRPPRVLVLSMYPLDEGWSGPTVRIRRVLDALRRRASVEVIDGYRPARRVALARYAASGRLRAVDGIYVEASTALPAEADLTFLGLARALGRPVLTYVRDAYQLFPDYYPITSPKRWLSARAFPWAMRGLGAVSTQLAFPSRGLAEAVLGPEPAGTALLLPPGAPPPVDSPRRDDARAILFVGDMRVPAQGGATLLDAVALARERGVAIELLCVTRDEGAPPPPRPSWLRIERASSSQIPGLLPDVLATVIPRVPGQYNDLALPIKLMEYLSYGRPIVATGRVETARLLRDAGAGIVAADGVEGLAAALSELAAAPSAHLDAWSAAARAAAEANSWDDRADRILRELAA